jgi:restriction endonuclease S subunit
MPALLQTRRSLSMAHDLHRRTVGDYVTLCRGTTYKGSLVGEPGPVLLGLGSIEPGGGFRFGHYKTYGGDCPPELMLAPGDLYAALKGATKDGKMIGSVARVPSSVPSGRLTQDTVKLVFRNPDHDDARYLYWILRTPQYRDYCAGHAMGSAVVALSRRDFLSYPVPPLTARRKQIVVLLEALDDKIELNRRMNETLEAIARAIFKSWFGDFDPVRAKASGEAPESICRRLGLTTDLLALFPNRFQDSELGEIPEGWEVSSVGDLADVTSGKRPDDSRERWSAEYQVPLWGGNGPMGFVSRALHSKPILLTGRVGTLGSVFRISCPCWPSDNTLIVIPKNPLGYEFLFFRLSEIDFRSLNRGSTQPLLSQTDLKVQRYVLPSVKLLESFHVLVRDIFSFIEAMNRESTRLVDVRDTVLPQLLFGELPVPVVGDA